MTIIEWLESPTPSYKEGVALFVDACRNRNKINYLTRKQDMVKLRYELGKLARCSSIAPPAVSAALPEKPHERLKIIRDGGTVRYQDMPAPIQASYKAACDYYKRMRSLHEKMKLVSTDIERAAVRKELLDVDQRHRECWATVDKWAADGTLPEEVPGPAEPAIDAKAVNAARVALGRDLKLLETATDEQKRADLLSRLKERVSVIQAADCTFGKNAAKLAELGLISKE